MITVVFHPDFEAEKRYVASVLLGDILGLSYQVKTDSTIIGYQMLLPSGVKLAFPDVFWQGKTAVDPYTEANIPASAGSVINPFDGALLTILFGDNRLEISEQQINCGFDIFASTFFMLTRWEDKASVRSILDEHGRFPASASLAYKAGFLHRPVVNEWAAFIGQCLVHLGLPETAIKQHRFETILSCDVDHPRLWWSKKEILRTLGGAFFRKDTLAELQYWWKNGVNAAKDPFDTFDEFMQWGEQHNSPVQFNFLSERPRHFDAWYDLKHPVIAQLMQEIASRGHIIGFHPSREAATDPERFRHEIAALRAIAPAPVVSGRHHYLCFQAPFTWRMWEDNQIETDSTLGYSDAPGFRCGICMPFPVFDFLEKRTLSVKEQPLIAMDVTFARYLQESPDETLVHLQNLRAQVQRFGGQFTLLWHNSSLNTWFWEPYRPVFEQILL